MSRLYSLITACLVALFLLIEMCSQVHADISATCGEFRTNFDGSLYCYTATQSLQVGQYKDCRLQQPPSPYQCCSLSSSCDGNTPSPPAIQCGSEELYLKGTRSCNCNEDQTPNGLTCCGWFDPTSPSDQCKNIDPGQYSCGDTVTLSFGLTPNPNSCSCANPWFTVDANISSGNTYCCGYKISSPPYCSPTKQPNENCYRTEGCYCDNPLEYCSIEGGVGKCRETPGQCGVPDPLKENCGIILPGTQIPICEIKGLQYQINQSEATACINTSGYQPCCLSTNWCKELTGADPPNETEFTCGTISPTDIMGNPTQDPSICIIGTSYAQMNYGQATACDEPEVGAECCYTNSQCEALIDNRPPPETLPETGGSPGGGNPTDPANPGDSETEEGSDTGFNIFAGPNAATFAALNPLTIAGSRFASQFSSPAGILNRAILFIFPLSGLLLFLMLVWGGFEIVQNAHNQKGLQAGKQRITAALIGFGLLFGSFWIVQIIEYIFGLAIL